MEYQTTDGVQTARIEARIASDVLEKVKRGAELQGRSISDFVNAAARVVARREIHETAVVRLALAQQKQFAMAILNPPKPIPSLKRAMKAYRKRVVRKA